MEVRLSRYAIQGRQFFLALVRDITERQTRERELERTNRLYATLSAVNRAIVGVKTREDLFREICRITVELRGLQGRLGGLARPRDATPSCRSPAPASRRISGRHQVLRR